MTFDFLYNKDCVASLLLHSFNEAMQQLRLTEFLPRKRPDIREWILLRGFYPVAIHIRKYRVLFLACLHNPDCHSQIAHEFVSVCICVDPLSPGQNSVERSIQIGCRLISINVSSPGYAEAQHNYCRRRNK